ncbi:hypothetical protein [uncultured Mucilaginibacter sp.]|uniref:hypothetical protein n=1 Tax=uncultured Mucilaginibacter sp. TaxID=797541 RepID=UPI002618E0C3|nr:hypothetical protein [uncultured Mucilaginibacter sp.]
MAKQNYSDELEKLKEYLKSESGEKSRQHYLYPLFLKLFKDKFKIEGDANGADGYVEGALIIESKSTFQQWTEGFYQALHYQRKFGLTYNTIIVIAHKYVGIWKLNKLPEYATILAHTASVQLAPNVVGKENARKTNAANKIEIKNAAFYWLEPKDLEGNIFAGARNLTVESFEILKILNNLDSDRLQINTHNFIDAIERMKRFFEHPIDAVHAFYAIVPYWDITSTVAETENGEIRVVGFKGNRMSETVQISPKHVHDFKKFIQTQYVFTNEGSGLTADYYFSRFDEVMAVIDPEYVKQHGIFFTDRNLSKFALWFAKHHFPGNINEDYIVFDPAAGSGNLVSSWRGKLKHKIVSELQPDLLRTIERRMKADPFHLETGFTIIPKTSSNKGLNFIDHPAADYLAELTKELRLTNVALDKPIAFLLNPPYKNTDEKQEVREQTESHYEIDPSILQLTGEDAGKERYLAFLGQIINMSKAQNLQNPDLKPIVMVFTPTSWLIPRANYIDFRKAWDQHFKYHNGFIVTSNEWFKLNGKWPLAFTIWAYEPDETGNKNEIIVSDLTHLSRPDLNINWNDEDEKVEKELFKVLKTVSEVKLDNSKGSIKNSVNQMQFAFKRDPTKTEIESRLIIGGLPLTDERRGNKKTYGIPNSSFVGFMDDNTPVRVNEDRYKRTSIKPDRVWFQLRPTFIDVNLTKIQTGPQDKYGYCAYDLASARLTFTWFAITKALNGAYPVWANQYDIWPPQIKPKSESYWYSLCFAFVLAENRCVVTKFEENNPVKGAPEVFVDNPLCPTNRNSFWNTTLDAEIAKEPDAAFLLVEKIKELYRYWNLNYCKGQYLYNVGLQNEPYFKYFDYPDFLTPYSGLIQIRKYAEQEGLTDLLELFLEVIKLTKLVKAEIYRLLVKEFKYFD